MLCAIRHFVRMDSQKKDTKRNHLAQISTRKARDFDIILFILLLITINIIITINITNGRMVSHWVAFL